MDRFNASISLIKNQSNLLGVDGKYSVVSGTQEKDIFPLTISDEPSTPNLLLTASVFINIRVRTSVLVSSLLTKTVMYVIVKPPNMSFFFKSVTHIFSD